MNRDEAVSLLKEIVAYCDGLNEAGVMLMPPEADDVLSHGYQLHIKAWSSNEPIYSCVKKIADKHALSIASEPDKDLIVIYRPMKKEEMVTHQ